jgi:hypothetical protein
MSSAPRIRVTLRWIEILASLEPFFDDTGEFRFVAIVTAHGRPPRVTMIPEMGHIPIASAIGRNRIELGTILFDDLATHALTVDIGGEEVDLLTPNERLPAYRRTFRGDPETWLGRYAPGDETPGRDPESLGAWRLCYDIEPSREPRRPA